MDNHPAAFLLEAHAAGETNHAVAEHIATCIRCKDALRALEAGQAALLQAESPADFARRIRLAGESTSARRLPFWRWLVPLATAAATAGIVLAWNPWTEPPPAEPTSSSAEREGAAPDIRWRGGAQLAVVVQRGDQQFRAVDAVALRAGDSLRAELALEANREVSVGILDDAGEWVSMGANLPLQPGRHYLPTTLRVDDDPTPGWLLAGPPEEVERIVRGQLALEDAAVTSAIRLEVSSSP